MKKPVISFIIPVYNREKYLPRCLDKLLKKATEIEIILIDDCSTDNSLNIIKKYNEKYNNIRWDKTLKNSGPGVSRNIGLELAEGDFCFFLDSDDTIDIDILSSLQEKLKSNSDVDIFILNAVTVEKDGYQRHHRIVNEEGRFCSKDLLERESFYPNFTVCFNVLRRRFIEENHLRFNCSYYNEDTSFALKAFSASKTIYKYPIFFYMYLRSVDNSLRDYPRKDRVTTGIREYTNDCNDILNRSHAPYIERMVNFCFKRMLFIQYATLNSDALRTTDETEFFLLNTLHRFAGHVRKNSHGRKIFLEVTNQKTINFYLCLKKIGLNLDGLLDNDLSDKNYNITMAREHEIEVFSPNSLPPGESLVYIFNHNTNVVDILKKQLQLLGLKENTDFFSIYDMEEFSYPSRDKP